MTWCSSTYAEPVHVGDVSAPITASVASVVLRVSFKGSAPQHEEGGGSALEDLGLKPAVQDVRRGRREELVEGHERLQAQGAHGTVRDDSTRERRTSALRRPARARRASCASVCRRSW